MVLDHFGPVLPAEADTPAERAILRLLGSGKAWVKLSGTYRLEPPDLGREIKALARRLHDANPQQVIWRSD